MSPRASSTWGSRVGTGSLKPGPRSSPSVSSVLQGHCPSRPRRGRGAAGRRGRFGGRPSARTAGLDRVSGDDPSVLRRSGNRGGHQTVVRGDRGRGARDRRLRPGHHRDGSRIDERCAPSPSMLISRFLKRENGYGSSALVGHHPVRVVYLRVCAVHTPDTPCLRRNRCERCAHSYQLDAGIWVGRSSELSTESCGHPVAPPGLRC